MRYEVHATITEIYQVEADSFEDALEIASDRDAPDSTHAQGFSYVLNLETRKELIL
jgi:hypothetical protein